MLSKQVAEKSKLLRYWSSLDPVTVKYMHASYMCFQSFFHLYCRQMRGEDLQGLTLDELQKLEKTLEAGLSRVLERKVALHFLFVHAI